MRSLTFVALSALLAISSVNAQSSGSASATASASLALMSASPSAITADANNTAASGASVGKAFKYFMQVWLENNDYSTVAALPAYQKLAEQGILLTNYNAITHPSEPNYVAAAGGSNLGITDDAYYSIPANVSSIWDLVEAKGLKWKTYQEDIPSYGFSGFSAHNGSYVRKHNPAIIFDSIGLNDTRSANVVPANVLYDDIAANNVPAYSFYTPNITNDGHDTTAAFAGDWVTNFWTSISNATFLKDALVLITFDENETYSTRNQVWALLLGGVIPANLKNTTDNTYYTHYSALSTVEQNWNLGNLGRGDANQTEANVFSFVANALGVTNVNVTNVPMNNISIPGMLTNQSWNATHPKSTSTPLPSSSANSSASGSASASGAIAVTAVTGLGVATAIVAAVLPYLL
ncbi:hypothetical protein BZG36_00483 [Bifiguratus adelaidae]|uniref:Acid phosphatase n=1 Tax=Bifiguratus adelaidae TaxID=1938954 RepID=A0A261Y7K5_9FUNG|nr:hypothetical protein BZG36_00483 [Bifiguratus adelaidae]